MPCFRFFFIFSLVLFVFLFCLFVCLFQGDITKAIESLGGTVVERVSSSVACCISTQGIRATLNSDYVTNINS